MPAAGNTSNAPRATVQMQQTGVILTVTPQITNNRQVQMKVHVENSDVQFQANDVGAVFPTQKVDNEVLVADGETAVMGGLTQTTVSVSRSGIPILVDLPIIGRLFGVTNRRETKRDLLILITPHIIDDGQLHARRAARKRALESYDAIRSSSSRRARRRGRAGRELRHATADGDYRHVRDASRRRPPRRRTIGEPTIVIDSPLVGALINVGDSVLVTVRLHDAKALEERDDRRRDGEGQRRSRHVHDRRRATRPSPIPATGAFRAGLRDTTIRRYLQPINPGRHVARQSRIIVVVATDTRVRRYGDARHRDRGRSEGDSRLPDERRQHSRRRRPERRGAGAASERCRPHRHSRAG